MTVIEKLDSILTAIGKSYDAEFNVNTNRMDNYLKSNGVVIPDNYLKLLLDKIEDDGYIKKLGQPQSSIYKIPLKGFLFIESGMYGAQKKIEDDRINALRLDNITRAENEQHQEDREELLKTYQKWVVISTVVAGLYYVKEIGLWIYHLISQCNY